jgi:hypothetical protein
MGRQLMSQQPELDRFAAALMRRVRDRAIHECDRLASGEMVGPSADYWREVMQRDARRAVEALIPSIVDQVLFELLGALDNDELPLAWRGEDDSLIPLEELGLGEMAGWLMGSDDSWRVRFSVERLHDPLPGLHLDLPPEPEPPVTSSERFSWRVPAARFVS